MNSIRNSVLISILHLAIAPAYGQGAQVMHTIFGNGGDCAQWIQPRDAANGHLKDLNSTWLTAYLSGINSGGILLGSPRKTDALKGISPAQVDLWMDNYCRTNPLKTVSIGARALYGELSSQ